MLRQSPIHRRRRRRKGIARGSGPGWRTSRERWVRGARPRRNTDCGSQKALARRRCNRRGKSQKILPPEETCWITAAAARISPETAKIRNRRRSSAGSEPISRARAQTRKNVNQFRAALAVSAGDTVKPKASCARGQAAAHASGISAVPVGKRPSREKRHAAREKMPIWNRLQAQRSSIQRVRRANRSRAGRARFARFTGQAPGARRGSPRRRPGAENRRDGGR